MVQNEEVIKMKKKSEVIFGNRMSSSVVKKAENKKERYIKKFGDDSGVDYILRTEDNPYIGESLGVKNIVITDGDKADETADVFDTEKGLIVGNIRMGFGHYRISMAIASAANYLGYTPYWMDLNSYQQTTGGKVIDAQNKLYSLGSRISAKSKAFNKAIWEPMNYEGFRKLSYNAADQANAELMTPVFGRVPKDIPLVATHVWPAQAAVHAGMKYVVNAVPDNWPMALHLAEGSLHTVQTRSAYMGYRTLNGMQGREVLTPMPSEDIRYTGHYIDHELVAAIEEDCGRRITRRDSGAPLRFLLTIGGAGAQKEIFAAIIKAALSSVRNRKMVLYVNVGDYRNVWDELVSEIPQMKKLVKTHFDNWEDTTAFAKEALETEVYGIHAFCHKNIYEAVYCTNLLMRSCDVLITKPSELAFYPVPKLFIKRVGGHEQWGAIHSAEIGDGTLECRDIPHTLQMMKLFMKDSTLIKGMCECIKQNGKAGIYDGAYKVVRLAMDMKKNR